MIKRIKSEYIILMLAWVFWAIAGIVSWNYSNKEIEYSTVLFVKSVQAAIPFFYNLIVVSIFIRVQKQVSHKHYKLILYILIIVVISLLTVFCNTTAFRFLMDKPEMFIKLSAYPKYTLQKIIYFTGFTALFFMIRNLKELQFQKEQLLEAKNLAVESQLQLLQQQINPHFLFNALNSLRSLISSDTTKAREMVTNISDFLRETLQSNNKDEISVSEEIKILESYLEIQKIRFGTDLIIKYHIEPEILNYKVPAFILQPLAENAIKHGMKTGTILKLSIRIKNRDNALQFSVRNNGKLEKENSIKGNGNANIQKRLELLYANNASFDIYESDNYVYSDIRIKQQT